MMADWAAYVIRLGESGGKGQSCEKYMPNVERAYYQKQRKLWSVCVIQVSLTNPNIYSMYAEHLTHCLHIAGTQ